MVLWKTDQRIMTVKSKQRFLTEFEVSKDINITWVILDTTGEKLNLNYIVNQIVLSMLIALWLCNKLLFFPSEEYIAENLAVKYLQLFFKQLRPSGEDQYLQIGDNKYHKMLTTGESKGKYMFSSINFSVYLKFSKMKY